MSALPLAEKNANLKVVYPPNIREPEFQEIEKTNGRGSPLPTHGNFVYLA
jgi:hypothetical protein